MKKANSVFAACTAALLTAAVVSIPAAGAENQSDNSSKLFHLNATKMEGPSLTRDPREMQLTHLAPKPIDLEEIGTLDPQPPVSVKQAQPTSKPATQPKAPVAAKPPALKTASAQTPAPSKSYLDEYNVDWSGWISAVSTSWFYNLRMMERNVNVQFVTDRPALIQFTCYPNGQIGNIALRQSSGVDVYDRLQMLALSQVAPLPPFPAGTQCRSITLVQGWESHIKRPGETGFDPISFGRGFPMEKVRQWVRPH